MGFCAHPVERLTFEALAVSELGANVLDADDIGTYAIEYALRGWRVFPLRGKAPAIPNPHPWASIERDTCKGECGLQGHGVLDATTDLATVIGWWAGRYAGHNIGVRVPEPMFVLDVDPRHGGLDSLIELLNKYGQLPQTLMTISGRCDGGMHLFYRRPPGKLSSKRLGAGIDIKTSTGYVVVPPSVHPDSGKPYVRIERPVAAPPRWLVELLQPEERPAPRKPLRQRFFTGSSPADQYCASATWAEILEPHGWRVVSGDGEGDGSRWRHPNATSPSSATIKHGCLFVYTPNTPFEMTETSNPHGQTKFRAYAQLNHGGDLRAAARSLRPKAIA